ncbi:MAG TPA: hypothetical protein VFX22_00330 [Candidatus Kapabacteria bacterium]|nr:hypothetical protein [Candidatus Kapabacteria bacterium]
MTATFRLEPGELNESFFEKLRTMFRDREVELIVHDVDSTNKKDDDRLQHIEELKEQNPKIASLIGVLKEPPDMWDYLSKKYQ